VAGLRCAARLTDLGREVLVIEAADTVGGRVRTDVVDGFRCDRGFQVLNPAYPAVRRWVDLDALALQSFGAGVMLRSDDGLRVVADPAREPRLLPQTLRSGYLRPVELAALARWAGLLPRRATLRTQPGSPLPISPPSRPTWASTTASSVETVSRCSAKSTTPPLRFPRATADADMGASFEVCADPRLVPALTTLGYARQSGNRSPALRALAPS
jgi:phytoene dehydrogenase-like protein